MIKTHGEDKAEKCKVSGITREIAYLSYWFWPTFSGYAFAFQNDCIKNPPNIKGNQWNKDSQARVSLKTSTSFGTEAEDRYTEMALNEKHQEWFFFRRFKMICITTRYSSACLNLSSIWQCKKTTALQIYIPSAIIYWKREVHVFSV